MTPKTSIATLTNATRVHNYHDGQHLQTQDSFNKIQQTDICLWVLSSLEKNSLHQPEPKLVK